MMKKKDTNHIKKQTLPDDPASSDQQESEKGTFSVTGMGIGVGLGIVFGKLLFDNLALGISVGVAAGMLIGTGIKKSK